MIKNQIVASFLLKSVLKKAATNSGPKCNKVTGLK